MSIFNPLDKFGLKNVIATCSRRQDGNMSLCFGDITDSLVNRQKFLSGMDIDYKNLVCAKQVHGARIEYITKANLGSGALDYDSSIAGTDGFITDQLSVPIVILTADCLSVFVYDPVKVAIAILHAGWRSTEQNIVQAAIRAMHSQFSSQAKNLLVGFGPSIRSCCFQVKDDFKSNFSFGLIKRQTRVFMDIALINQRQLISCGVKEKNIFDPAFCTFCKDGWFSFRKEDKGAGRLISVMMLK